MEAPKFWAFNGNMERKGSDRVNDIKFTDKAIVRENVAGNKEITRQRREMEK